MQVPQQSASNRERRPSGRGNRGLGIAAQGAIPGLEEAKQPRMMVKPMIAMPKIKERKRIFISGVNSLVGHALFEMLRNDHTSLKTGKKSNKFSGTMI